MIRLAIATVLTLLAGCQTAPAQPSTFAMVSPTPPPGSCHLVGGKADRACTPGIPNPHVTQANIQDTICRAGWTKTIRPPLSYTEPLKRRQMAAYGETGSLRDYEEDHLVALELGGDPRDPRNLFPQPWTGPTGAHAKDREENSLRMLVCARDMTLADAQTKLILDWSHT